MVCQVSSTLLVTQGWTLNTLISHFSCYLWLKLLESFQWRVSDKSWRSLERKLGTGDSGQGSAFWLSILAQHEFHGREPSLAVLWMEGFGDVTIIWGRNGDGCAKLPAYKHWGAYSSKVFRVTFLTLAASLTVPLLGVTVLLDCPIDPQPISLKEPPLLTGVLEPNVKLRKAERLWENQLLGPESIANIGDVLFTGTADGKIIKIEDGEIQTIARIGHGPCGTRDDEPTCGRPLGIRVGPNNTLFVADAYYGLYEVNPGTGETKMLVSTKTLIEGQKLSFVNDLTVTRDGRKIYFTDSSSKWQRRDYLYLIMEGSDDGRLLEYDTVTKEVKVLMVGLRFPNGVQLSPAEDFVLVQETTMARIRRYYVSGLMKGGADMFVENMPGLPDNIRLSSSGGYWVAMAAVRPNPGFSLLDFLSEKPWIKRMIFKLLSQETVTKFVPKYSLVVELSETGAYKRSFHDPNGVTVAYVSEAHEHNGYLYLGSFRSPFICRLNLQHV